MLLSADAAPLPASPPPLLDSVMTRLGRLLERWQHAIGGCQSADEEFVAFARDACCAGCSAYIWCTRQRNPSVQPIMTWDEPHCENNMKEILEKALGMLQGGAAVAQLRLIDCIL